MKSIKAVWAWLIIGLALVSQRSLALYATYNYKGGVVGGDASGLPDTPGLFSKMEIKLDFAAIAAARVAAGMAALVATDVLELFGVKAGTWVQMVAIEVTKAEGAACTMDVGDGTGVADYISNADANALGWTTSLVTSAFSVAVGGGKVYTADDTIDLRLDHNSTDLAVVTLHVVAVDLRKYRS